MQNEFLANFKSEPWSLQLEKICNKLPYTFAFASPFISCHLPPLAFLTCRLEVPSLTGEIPDKIMNMHYNISSDMAW